MPRETIRLLNCDLGATTLLPMNLDERQQAIIDEFSMVGDWMERYQYLVQLGRMMDPLPEADKTDANLIRGCQSQVWVAVDDSGDDLKFRG